MPDLKSAKLIETFYRLDEKTKTVYTRTVITTIGNDRRIKPQSPLWAIVNNGDQDVIMDNSYKISAGDRFGVDLTPVVLAGYNIVNETEFQVSFQSAL